MTTQMKLLAALLATVTIALGPGPRAAPRTMPFDEVRAGMRGEGRTVFRTTEIESFDVEILGTLPNSSPHRNLILARLSGGPLAETGVMAGMSGSPVFVEDRLVGAVAYSWGFTTEAIAAITPIDEMLELLTPGPASASRGGTALVEDDFRRLGAPHEMLEFLTSRLAVRDRGWPLSAEIPLSVGGIGAPGIRRLSRDLAGLGMRPVPSSAAAPGDVAVPPLRPGSAIGLKLVRGDVDVTATGTATWVEGEDVIGFGHPLLGLGSIDLPLTAARVEALVPNLSQSFRLARPLAELGALRQDRAAGVAGRLGATPEMIPVRLELTGPSRPPRRFSFDIADDPLLSPLLLYVSLNGILAGEERVIGAATVRLRDGSVIRLEDGPSVQLDNLFAGPHAFELGTGLPAYLLHLLMNNTWNPPRVVGINLLIEHEPRPRTAEIRQVSVDRYRVRAGDSARLAAVIQPDRGPREVRYQDLLIPEEARPGKLTVTVADAISLASSAAGGRTAVPTDLEQLVALINRLRRNDGIHVVATQDAPGVWLAGTRLSNLPPSVASVLLPPGTGQRQQRLDRHAVVDEVMTTEFAVNGIRQFQLEVVGP